MDVPESVDPDLDCSQCEGKYHDIKENQLLNYKDHQGSCFIPIHSLRTNDNFSSQSTIMTLARKKYHSCGVRVLFTRERTYAWNHSQKIFHSYNNR